MKLLKVTIFLSHEKLKFNIREYEVKETKNTFKITKELSSNQDIFSEKVISKSAVGVVDSRFKNNINSSSPYISYSVWGFEKDLDSLKKILKVKTEARLQELKTGLEGIIKSFYKV